MIKRIFDLTLAILLIIIFLPFLLIVCVFVYLSMGRPVFFKQIRPGLSGKPFEMIKFRTMLNLNDDKGNLTEDKKRLTAFGKFLRSTSIDEVPELWNVIKGEMSIVGPRPLLIEYLPLYSEFQFQRHNVKPGITGWAQINGRNSIDWKTRFDYDIWYVENHTIWLDLKILLITFKKVLKSEGISANGVVTMNKFTGNKE
jgi:lipopolysaccharide/colanic/teichoic acid biosynthesis glycosyltransferase